MKHFPTAPVAPRRARVGRVLVCACVLIGSAAIVPWKVVAQQSGRSDSGDDNDRVTTHSGNLPDVEPEPRAPAAAPGDGAARAPDPRVLAAAERGFLKSTEVNLAAATDGIVVQVGAEDGQSVKKGQLVVRLNDRKAMLGLQASKARLAEAEAKAKRAGELYQSKQVSEAENEQVALQREQARIELALREQELEETRVVSPIDGALERLLVRPGEFVARGGPLARVVGMDAFWADVLVGTDAAARLKPGGPAALRLGGRDRRSLKGRVRYVSNIVRSGSQSTLVRVDVIDPPAGLKPGMEVVVDFDGVK